MIPDDPESELRDWQQLIDTKGFQRLLAYGQKHYSSKVTLDKVAAESDVTAIRACLARRDGADDVLGLPFARVKALEEKFRAAEAAPVVARRA